MRAKIIKIDPLKTSRTEKSFRRMYFLLENGKWAKTDIVPAYHNYKTWRPIVELVDKGAILFIDGVELRQDSEVDADSKVQITLSGFEIKKNQDKKIIQDTLL